MKQRRFGRKVQNWHRPLDRNEWKHRYRRMRSSAKETHADLARPALRSFEIEAPVDPCGNDDCMECHGRGTPLTENARNVMLLCRLRCETEPGGLARALAAAFEHADARSRMAVDDAAPAPDGVHLERRLAEHVAFLHSGTPDHDALIFRLIDSVATGLDLVALHQSTDQLGRQHLLQNLVLFAPFWLRSPARWRSPGKTARENAADLVAFLFARFPIPAPLLHTWVDRSAWFDRKWMLWTILFGQGGSLRRTAPHFGWQIHTAFQRHLLDAPPDSSPELACMRAAVLSLGGNDRLARVLQDRGSLGDPSEPSTDPRFDRFRTDAIRWFARRAAALTDAELGMILNWAMHEYTENLDLPQPFAWSSHGKNAALRAAQRYREAYILWGHAWSSVSKASWPSYGLEMTIEDGETRWDFVELTNAKALVDESAAMHHCVATYIQRCISGHSGIVSVRANGVRALTIELRPDSLDVVQVCGAANRRPTAGEVQIVSSWIEAMAQRMGRTAPPEEH